MNTRLRHLHTTALLTVSLGAFPWVRAVSAQIEPDNVAQTLSQPIGVEPLEIAAIDRTGKPGPWQPYRPRRTEGDPAASSLNFGAAETRRLRAPGPIFVPTDGAGCQGFDPICFNLCSQTRFVLTDCNRTYGGIRISAVSSASSSGNLGNTHQIYLAWTNKRNPGELDDFNPARPIMDTVIEVIVYDQQFDPNCGPGQGNITGGVLVNFGPLPALCGQDSYYQTTLNLVDFPGVCITVPGPSLPFGYEVRFWYDAQQSAPAANNQAILWGSKEPVVQGQTLPNGYVDDDYDGFYDPNTECTNLNLQQCPDPLAAAVDFWGNTNVGKIILWNNGPFVTGFLNGCGGGDTSVLELPGVVLGMETNINLMHQADDFIVPIGQTWTLDNLTWYFYQPLSAPGDPIVAAYIQLWDGVPGGGGNVIAGDLTTNRLISSEFVETYRIEQGDPLNCERAIKAALIDMTWAPLLNDGNYWIQIGAEGLIEFQGPLSNPVVPRRPSEDNSRSFDVDSEIWTPNVDGDNAFDLPFELEGMVMPSGCEPAYQLRLSGACPGQVIVQWENATPNVSQGLVFGNGLGQTRIPESFPCTGTVLGVRGSVRLVEPPGFFSTQNGSGSISGHAGEFACGRYLQLVEGGSCNTSNVAQIPQN